MKGKQQAFSQQISKQTSWCSNFLKRHTVIISHNKQAGEVKQRKINGCFLSTHYSASIDFHGVLEQMDFSFSESSLIKS